MNRKGSSDRVILLTLSDFFLLLMLIFFLLFISVSHRLNRSAQKAGEQPPIAPKASAVPAAEPIASPNPNEKVKSQRPKIGSGPVLCRCDHDGCQPDPEGKGTIVANVEILDNGLKISSRHSHFRDAFDEAKIYTPMEFREEIGKVFQTKSGECRFKAKRIDKFNRSRSYSEIEALQSAFWSVFR